jgi:uncharacterized protein
MRGRDTIPEKMRLFNQTRQTLIASDMREAMTFSEKARGLLGTHAPTPTFFRTRWGIHTFGMRYAIDVVICDRNFRVQKVVAHLKPNRFLFWNPLYPYVFELPKESARMHHITPGNILVISE